MAWADVPAKLTQYDGEEYADDSNETLPSFKLVSAYVPEGRPVILANVPELLRDDLEKDLDYRLGACVNLAESKGWNGDKLRKAMS